MDALRSLLPMDAQLGPLIDGRLVEWMVLATFVIVAAGILLFVGWLVRSRRRG
ncbi:MAG: hypothetical protein IPL36_06555 [Nigerium sp.]|nr:hypothetical protein [Nigerium sp.]